MAMQWVRWGLRKRGGEAFEVDSWRQRVSATPPWELRGGLAVQQQQPPGHRAPARGFELQQPPRPGHGAPARSQGFGPVTGLRPGALSCSNSAQQLCPAALRGGHWALCSPTGGGRAAGTGSENGLTYGFISTREKRKERRLSLPTPPGTRRPYSGSSRRGDRGDRGVQRTRINPVDRREAPACSRKQSAGEPRSSSRETTTKEKSEKRKKRGAASGRVKVGRVR
ncbi:hypothetical protein EYF80_035951 [Liparis tanakae]|uniref:Uncharacterized protein n=1 Tax=Liparis tanakae TaxID=230148 RepID=A0A4Z2GK14_9TELE|nr:hypothetical protein EYF80_035951 [Liparis tanakae]